MESSAWDREFAAGGRAVVGLPSMKSSEVTLEMPRTWRNHGMVTASSVLASAHSRCARLPDLRSPPDPTNCDKILPAFAIDYSNEAGHHNSDWRGLMAVESTGLLAAMAPR